MLRFTYVGDGRFEDDATGSVWTITGRATEGPKRHTARIERISHGDYFAFIWMAFRPNATIYTPDAGT